MTERKDLLRPLEPARRLAKADRDALDALLAAVADCQSLIATERTALQQATHAQQERLQDCVDAVGRLSEEIGAAGRDDEARHAELTEAVRQVPAAVAGLPERLDEAGAKHASGIRSDIAALRGSLAQLVCILEKHNSQLIAMADAVLALAATVAALDAHGEDSRQERTSRNRTLSDLVDGTVALAARVGQFKQMLTRHKPGFWALIAFPLLLAFVYGAGLMTDFMIRFLDGSLSLSVPLVTDLPPWPLPDAGTEAAPPE